MSTPISVRFPDEVASRLRRRSTQVGEPASGLVVRLVDEGMRMQEHPGVVFRDGPAGRRAGLAGGPDVWEVIVTLKDFGAHGPAEGIEKSAAWLGLSQSQVRTAEGYYGAYPEEIDAHIAANATAAGEAAQATAVRDRLYG